MVDRTLYEQFAAVAEELSFTTAAARLNVAQPWLSARIRQLERQLGFALFVRTTRRVELTPKGAALLPRAQAIGRALEEFHDAARALGGEVAPLRLGAPLYTGRIQVARRLLDTLRAHRPAIRFDLDIGWSRQLLAKLAAKEADAVLLLGPDAQDGLDRLHLAEAVLEVEVDADDPLADGLLTPDRFAGRTIQTFGRDSNPGLFDAFFDPLRAQGAILREATTMWSEKPGQAHGSATLVGAPSLLWPRLSQPRRIRRAVDGVPAAPFCLLRRREAPIPTVDILWRLAESLRATGP